MNTFLVGMLFGMWLVPVLVWSRRFLFVLWHERKGEFLDIHKLERKQSMNRDER